MTPSQRRRIWMGMLLLAAAPGCGLLTASLDADVPNIRGSWRLTGTQTSPSAQFDGTLGISTQSGPDVGGTAIWEETSGGGGVRVDGGAVSGRVLSEQDVDLDIGSADGERRFIGLLVADTISGTWVQPAVGRNGTFRAVRGVQP